MAQQNRFTSEFRSYAREIADIAENNAKNAFEQLQNLATSFTSYGIENRHFTGGFPNVTIPHFDILTERIVNYTGVDMVIYIPFVEGTLKHGWEHFINKQISKHHHYFDSYVEMTPYNASECTCNTTYTIVPCRSCLAIDETQNGFLNVDEFMQSILYHTVATRGGNFTNVTAPVAQYGPLPRGNGHGEFDRGMTLMMQDLIAHPIFRKEMTAALEYNVPVISETLDVDFLLSHSRTYQDELHKAMTSEAENSQFHDNFLFGDMLRSFTLDAIKESFEEDAKSVGFIVSILPWGAFFEKVLTAHSDALTKEREINGLVVKVVSDCGGVFTYVINGGKSDMMFAGDQRDLYNAFHEVEHSSRFFWKDHPSGLSKHCHFNLHVYPSHDFYAFYNSRTPIASVGAIFAVFIFTAILFSFYDQHIFKRQRHVITHATSLIINNAQRATINEREMNDFIAHEVRKISAARRHQFLCHSL